MLPDEPWVKTSASADEVERLRWLDGRANAPRVLGFDPRSGLTMTRLPGVHAGSAEFGSAAEGTVRAMAEALRTLHEVPADDCPWVLDTPTRLATLRARFTSEALDPARLSPAYRRYSAEKLLEIAEQLAAGCDDELVVTHGNAQPSHILIDAGRPSGLVSFAELAVADRFRDLTLLALHIAASFPAELVPLVFDAYGISNPNPLALDLAQLLLELEG